ncbi:MAG: DHH family phosphoesterase [Campylobacterales bacterium]
MRVFHLSHTDLDGYSCQLITRRFFESVHCYNSGYGPEVTAKLGQIEEHMGRFSAKEEKLLLITDLNITKDECKLVEKMRERLGFLGHKITVQLLDHHKSGEAQAKEFAWYLLDCDRSATKITYDWCCEQKSDHEAAKDAVLNEYVQCVNAYDIWLTGESERFEFGKVLNRLVMDSREVSTVLFTAEDTAYRHFVLQEAFAYIENNRYIELDDQIIAIKKRFLTQGGAHDTLDNLAARYVVELLGKNRDRLTIEYKGQKGLLTYQAGNISVLGNAFLKANPDYDFFMDVNRNGNVSLRADGKLDVSVMAAKLFGGGGHANASGGRIQGFKEIFVYEQLKDRIRDLIANLNIGS